MNAWQQSGLSRPEYLKAHQLSASQFSYYYRNHFPEVEQVANDSKPAGLVRYLESGLLDIDNNAAERAIKPFVIGRKNSGSLPIVSKVRVQVPFSIAW